MGNLEGAYPLSPLQAGMLYQSLLATGTPERAGYDIEQVQISLTEQLDLAVLVNAWTATIRRYPVLSNRFRWKGVSHLEQLPQADVVVPSAVVDWSQGDVATLREEFLAADRRLGFNLAVAPLMRITVASLGGARYELFWTFHRILMDGRSTIRVLREVFAAYAALLNGQPPSFEPEVCSYAGYIAWLGTRDHSSSLAFFKQLLADKQVPTPLPLAESAARPIAQTGYGVVTRMLSPDIHAAMLLLAKSHQTTVGGVLQVAWGLVLSRLTGDPDVVFGINRSCRYSVMEGAIENTVGLLINSLPARVRVDDQATVNELLTAAREQWVAQRHHDQTPLIDVQGQSGFGPGLPLFETLLMYDNRELNQQLRSSDPAWHTRTCTIHEQPSVPLTIIATDGDVLELKFLYDRRRYRQVVVERIMEYLRTALASLPQATLVGDVDIVPQHELDQLRFGWNATELGFEHNLLIHQLFEARADAMPDAIAVEVNDETFTFAEIEVRANRLGNLLRQRGAGPGCFVGLCLSRSVDLVVGLLGIAKSGAAYVPVDPDYPADRIEFMMEDTNATLVVSEPRYGALFKSPVISLSSKEVATASVVRPVATAQSGDVCYAIYTSGSTGKPKGVILTHRAVINTLAWVSRTFHVGPGDRALFVTSPCFDLSVYDTFGILGAGGTVVIATTRHLQEPRQLVRLLVEQRITIWDSAPAALQRLVTMFPDKGGTNLRLVMLSGDWIPLSLPGLVNRAFPEAQIMSLGGATEAAIWSNWFAVDGIDPSWNSIPYGRPIQNAQYYVLDKQRKTVPIGVTGDLYISGECLANGYLNRPELTAERFVDNPFRPGERMYMTGDLARYFESGDLEFLGRADFQVKIRGYRIELGEVEAALLAIRGVSEALCSAFVDASCTKVLVAYVVPRQRKRTINQNYIKQQLRKHLPDYMVPSRIMILTAMPLSANGKVDRNALPAPIETDADSIYVAPRSAAEIRMAAIWQYLLKRERVGLNDNFFALGGDSLLAVSLVVEIEQEFNVEFPLARVLEHPTLKKLAASVQQNVVKGKHLVTLNVGGSRPPLVLFCGIGGYGFFFHGLAQQLGPEQPVHVLHAVGADDGNENVDKSVEEMAAIYESQILEVCPPGPVILGGYSFGALIAYELADRLQRAGRPVPFVVSFDGPAPGHPQLLPLGQRVLKHIGDWLQLDSRARRDYFKERLANIARRFSRLEDDARLTPAGLTPTVDLRLRKVAAALWRARSRYRPAAPMNSGMLLFKADTPMVWPGCRTDAVYGWQSYVTGLLDTVTIPGTHLKFFGVENDVLMAAAIASRVDKLQ